MADAGTDEEARARGYHRWQLVLSAADVALTAGILLGWQASGAAPALAARLGSPAGPAPAGPAAMLVVAAMAAAVGGSCLVATFPLDLVGGFLLPRRAGLLVQPFRDWLADRAKGVAIGGALGLASVQLIYALLRWSPATWWLWSAVALALLGVLLTAILPVWLVPLFYRLTPLDDASLRARVLALAGRVGVPATEVSVADFSRKGPTANAAVVGLGRTRRILVSDTLVEAFPPAEVEVVLAHELAHHARGHLRQGLVLQGLLGLGVLWLAHRILAWGSGPAGLAGPADPAGLPLLALGLLGPGLLATPVAAAWSRRLERAADRIALEVTRAPEAFVSAIERLGRMNLAERRPGRVKQWLLATHPSPEQRIAVGRGWAASDRVRGAAPLGRSA